MPANKAPHVSQSMKIVYDITLHGLELDRASNKRIKLSP
jgi:hypothetical protein